MDGVPLGVRKGAWTEEEDNLLRDCIEKDGEGKWHQVPRRAGLNRCRKSCRLRWLNYLRPNIKRGNFTVDEVDLIIRLHKLLGNRWSLIAGRLPGRTSNDVKNYWNTHLQKKKLTVPHPREAMNPKTQNTMRTNIIRPRPRTFSKNLPWLKRGETAIFGIFQKRDLNPPISKPSPPSPPPEGGKSLWDDVLVDPQNDNFGMAWSVSVDASNEEGINGNLQMDGDHCSVHEDQSDWSDIFIDNLDLWNLLGDDDQEALRTE